MYAFNTGLIISMWFTKIVRDNLYQEHQLNYGSFDMAW